MRKTLKLTILLKEQPAEQAKFVEKKLVSKEAKTCTKDESCHELTLKDTLDQDKQ